MLATGAVSILDPHLPFELALGFQCNASDMSAAMICALCILQGFQGWL